MKIKKRVLCPERLRRIPGQFSWIDQRLVRDRYLQRCDHGALALYLVLLTVADAEGLSYYSDTTLERMLNMEHGRLLNAHGVAEPVVRSGQPSALADILRRMVGGAT